MLKQWRAKGTKANYDAAGKHLDMIYFAEDTLEILVNGVSYGTSKDFEALINEKFKSVSFDFANTKLIFTKGDNTTAEVTLAKPVQGDGSVTVTEENGNYTLNVAIKAENNALKKADDGSLYVDDSALTSYHGKEAIIVEDGDTAGVKDVKLVINTNEKFLSQNTNGLLATIGLAYDETNRKIQLTGNGAEVIAEITADAFVKDGMVSEVDLVVDPEGQASGTYLAITWNTDSGKSEPTYVNVTSLIDVYVQGNGINITDKTISVVIDPASEAYLTVGATGVKLDGVKAAIDDAVKAAKDAIDAYTVNGKAISSNPVLSGADIALTGYVQGTDASDISATDTVNAAISKILAQVEAANAWYVG